MASEYGIATVSELETQSSRDYSTYAPVSGTSRYTDDIVEGQITVAERMVIAEAHKIYGSDAPVLDGIKVCVLKIAEIRMENLLIKDRFLDGEIIDDYIYFQTYLKDTLAKPKRTNYLIGFQSVEDV